MDTSDNIIIVELKRIVQMPERENRLLKAKVNYLEQELARITNKKDSSNSYLPPSKDDNRPPHTSSFREKSGRKAGGQHK